MAEQPEDKEARITLPISASSALLAMGFGLWWAWTDSFYLASPGASPSATSMIPSERCFISLGCGLALIALLLKQRRQKERAPRGIVWASALCMSVLPFIARVIPLYTEESSWRVLLLLVAGFASAPLFLEWLSKIAGNSDEPSLIVPLALVVDVAVNGLAYLLGATLPSAKYAVLQLVLPLVSAVVFAKAKPISSGNKPYAQTIAKEHAPHGATPWILLAGSLLFAFDFALLLECISSIPESASALQSLRLLGPLASAALFITIENILHKRGSLSWGLKFIVTPSLAMGFLALPVIGFQVPAISCTITWIGIDYFVLTFFTLLCQIIRRVQIPARPLLAQGIASNCIGLALGAFVGKAICMMANPSPLLFSIIALIVVTSIIWIAFWMIDDRKVDTLWGLDKKPAQLVHDERICQCCDAITATYGLTPREHEIIVMLAHNRTVSDIAGDLIISVRTVNTHMNNIYRKLDIHSRNELSDLLRSTQGDVR